MPENQGHGKFWERELALNVYNATQEELDTVSHTAPIDVPRAFNRLEGVDISVKVSGGDAIDMGDILRVFKEVSSGDTIHMTVIQWTQKDDSTKKLKSITEVDLTNSVHLLFGKVSLSEIEELVTYVKSIPHHGRTKEHQAIYKKMAFALKEKSGGWISYAPKVDSKTQRRVQGHFTQFQKFLEEHPERIVAQSQTNEFRGGKISEEISSTKRIRHKKPKSDLEPHSPPI